MAVRSLTAELLWQQLPGEAQVWRGRFLQPAVSLFYASKKNSCTFWQQEAYKDGMGLDISCAPELLLPIPSL